MALAGVSFIQWLLGAMLIFSSLGVILAKKPMHSGLFFLLVLLTLAGFYLELSAQFIAAVQLLIYAGAILVIFVFVIVLFQDAHAQIIKYASRCKPLWLALAAFALTLTLVAVVFSLTLPPTVALHTDKPNFGTVQSLGIDLYSQFFFPFEVASLVILLAIVGVIYFAKKES